MKFLISGISGFLGYNVSAYLSQKKYEIIGLYHQHKPKNSSHNFQIDILNNHELDKIFEKTKPDIILHFAGISHADYCENHPEEAYELNVTGTKFMIENAFDHGAEKFIYISSDLVFGQHTKMFYSEIDTPKPTSVYATTKGEAEKLVLANNGTVLRSSLMYGMGTPHRKSFFHTTIENFRAGNPVNLFSDQYRTPIYTFNLAQIIEEISFSDTDDLWNVGGAERISRYEFGLRMCDYFGFDKGLCHPITIDDLNLVADRPKDCSLDITKIQQTLKKTQVMSITDAFNHLKDIIR